MLKKIAYRSEFSSTVDNLNPQSYCSGFEPLDFSQAYDAVETLDAELTSATEKWLADAHMPTLNELLGTDLSSQSRTFHEIESDCGDDEAITTDSASYGPLRINAGPVISRIKLSRKDSGASKRILNYTEGWIVTPPTAESCFEAVNRRHRGSGVPFLLDPVKLKNLSAVRKQSLKELDLPSKIEKQFEMAGWVARGQLSYDYHQMACILGITVFDFRDSRSFPYLYRTEGGCGGSPPFDNTDTVESAIHFFHKGKAQRTIYGLMKETVEIYDGRRAPNETFFVRSSHIAQLGDEAWKRYNAVYRSILKGNNPSDARNLISILANKKSLPSEILEKGVEIPVDDVTKATAIAHLRREGFLLTELDVKLSIENRKKVLGLGGRTPFREILQEIEEEKKEFQSNSYKVLGTIADYLSKDERNHDVFDLFDIPSNTDGDEESCRLRKQILRSYYKLRQEHNADFTSFTYSDSLRVFKSSDVSEYVKQHGNVLRETITRQLDPRLKMAKEVDIPSEKARKEEILGWIEKDDIHTLLANPLPPGIGPDDGRIVQQVCQIIDGKPSRDETPNVFVLFSSDRALGRTIRDRLRRRAPDKNWIVVQVFADLYMALCANDLRRSLDREPHFRQGRNVEFYNFLNQSKAYFPKTLFDNIQKEVSRIGKVSFFSHTLYDFPNLERTMELAEWDPAARSIIAYGGGYLRRESLDLFGHKSWAAQPLDKFFRHPDFNCTSRMVYGLKTSQNDRRIKTFANQAMPPSRRNEITTWSAGVHRTVRLR